MASLTRIISLAQAAGRAVLEIYKKDFFVKDKSDGSPLTEADLASNRIITEGLKKLDPSVPVLSEENQTAPYKTRKSWKRFWLVDPLDGTKEFISKTGEFTINIALVEDNKPILGVVYVPVTESTYYANSKGAFKQTRKAKPQKLPCKNKQGPEGPLRVVASRSHFDEKTRTYIVDLGKPYTLLHAGSSLKLCLVAEGKADLYPRLGPTMEWDTAAAHAVCRFAGKQVARLKDGAELEYNKEDLRNPFFVVS